MRYLFIVFLFLGYASTGQVIRTAGIALGTTVPTHTPTAQGALKYYNYSSGTTYKWYNSAWVVEATGSGSDDQNLDTFDIVANTLRISVEDDGVPFYSVDLSPYLDDTDTQLSEEQVEDYVGGMTVGNTVSLITVTYQDADGTIDFVVEPNLSNYTNDAGFLTSEVDGSVSNELQTVDTFSLSGTVLSITLSGDGEAPYTVDLVSLQDGTGTDDQNLTVGGSGPTYTIDIEDGTDITVEAGGIIALSEPTANTLKLIGTEVDGSVTNEIQYVDTLALSGTNLGVSLSQDGVGQTTVDLSSLQDGTGTDDQVIDTFDIVTNQLRISVESDGVPAETVDLSPYLDNTDAQGLTIGGTGPYTVDISGGADVTIEASGITTLSEPSANVLRFTTTEVDGSVSNEIQNLDTFTIESNVLRASLLNDGIPFSSVDLSPYLDNTDTQDLSIDSAGNWYTVSLVNGGSVNIAKDTDTQLTEEQVEDFVGGMVTGNTETLISVTYQDGDGTIDFEVEDQLSLYTNDAGFLTSETDDQKVDTFAIVSNVLRLSVESDAEPFKSVDLSPYLDDTDTDNQVIDTFTIVSNVLRLSLQDDAVPFEDVDLSPYLDNTDAQTLSFSNPNLSISGGNSVDISGIDTDTDDQGLTIGGSGPTYTVDIDGGADVTIAAGGINTLSEGTANILTITATEVDGSTTNEIQDLSLTGNALSLTSDASTVDLSGYLDNTDDQGLTVTGSGPDYVINQEDGTDITVSAAGIATLSEPSANELRITATEVDGSTTNEIQTIDTFTIVSNVLRASLLNDGVPFEDVDLSPYLDNTDAQSFSGSDDGTTFTLDLSGAATDIAFKEGSNVTITRTGTELTFASTGSADNWGTDVVNKNGTLTGDGTVASVLKVDTTIIATKDHVYKGKVSQESSETIKTSNFTAVKHVIHPVDCSAGTITVTPPSSPAIGDRFAIVDSEAAAGTNNITVDFTTGSYKLYTAVQNYIINVDGGYVEFIYMGTTTGWVATKG